MNGLDVGPQGVSCGSTELAAPLEPLFRCRYCVKVIEDGRAVYMCRDESYCSSTCRKKDMLSGGVAGIPPLIKKCSSESHDSAPVFSDTTRTSVSGTTGTAATSQQFTHGGRGGLLTWILGEGLTRLADMVKGTELLRTSSGTANWSSLNSGDDILRQITPLSRSDDSSVCLSQLSQDNFWDLAMMQKRRRSSPDFCQSFDSADEI